VKFKLQIFATHSSFTRSQKDTFTFSFYARKNRYKSFANSFFLINQKMWSNLAKFFIFNFQDTQNLKVTYCSADGVAQVIADAWRRLLDVPQPFWGDAESTNGSPPVHLHPCPVDSRDLAIRR
jgi:hypothetical protein